MKAVLLALIVVMAVLYGETKHIHPRNHNEDEVIIEKICKRKQYIRCRLCKLIKFPN